MSLRPIKKIIKSRPTLEGAGVHLHRAFGFGNTTDLTPSCCLMISVMIFLNIICRFSLDLIVE